MYSSINTAFTESLSLYTEYDTENSEYDRTIGIRILLNLVRIFDSNHPACNRRTRQPRMQQPRMQSMQQPAPASTCAAMVAEVGGHLVL
jgi:hypothetical protein